MKLNYFILFVAIYYLEKQTLKEIIIFRDIYKWIVISVLIAPTPMSPF